MFERLKRMLGLERGVPLSGASSEGDPAISGPIATPYRPGLPALMRETHASLLQGFEQLQVGDHLVEHDELLAGLRLMDQALHGYLAGPESEFHAFMSDRLANDLYRMQVLRVVRARLRHVARELHDSLQERRPHSPLPPVPALGRMVPGWTVTLRECLAQLERELLPLYAPPAGKGERND